MPTDKPFNPSESDPYAHLMGKLPQVDPPTDLTDRIMQRIAAETAPAETHSPQATASVISLDEKRTQTQSKKWPAIAAVIGLALCVPMLLSQLNTPNTSPALSQAESLSPLETQMQQEVKEWEQDTQSLMMAYNPIPQETEASLTNDDPLTESENMLYDDPLTMYVGF